MKPVIAAVIVFVVISAGMYFLCANAHIDIFECDITEHDFNAQPDALGKTPLVQRTGSCSVLDTTRPPFDGERSELTGLGWGIVIAFCGGIGAIVGGGVFFVMRKKAAA